MKIAGYKYSGMTMAWTRTAIANSLDGTRRPRSANPADDLDHDDQSCARGRAEETVAYPGQLLVPAP
jgi:hypothetical protein